MAQVLEQAVSGSSDNEEIDKLFPRCRPKSHLNLNCSGDLNHNHVSSDMDRANDNYLPHNHRTAASSRPASQSSCCEPPPPPPPPPAQAVEDRSVTSAYDLYDYETSPTTVRRDCGEDASAYEAEQLDEGHFRLDPGFCLRESRIEIAGGREIFSKSRSKPKKLRNQSSCKDRYSADVMYDERLRRYTYNSGVDRSRSRYCGGGDIVEENGGGSPEHRPHVGVMQKSASVRGLQDVGSTRGRHHLVYEAPVTNAEVVYDDIGELRVKAPPLDEAPFAPYPGVLESPGSDGFRAPPHRKPLLGLSSPVSQGGGRPSSSQEEMDTDSEPPSPAGRQGGIARLIGGVPIAEYEGSPRRYGPRPGYPQRVTAAPDAPAPGQPHPTTCEELLKVISGAGPQQAEDSGGGGKDSEEADNRESEIRSILKEFGAYTNGGGDREARNNGACLQDPEFSELEYRLYRVNTGSSYVGRRLAHASGDDSSAQESPRRGEAAPAAKLVNGDVPRVRSSLAETPSASGHATPPSPPPDDPPFLPNEQELLLLHESVHQHTLQVAELSEVASACGTELELAETEVGEQVGERNFTLSPETTDCDSNGEVESLASLEGSLHSANRLASCSSMPVLEDGLSSGRSSEPESSEDELDSGGWSSRKRSSEELENPALALINKQISKIEQDFCKRTGGEKVSQDVAEYLWRHQCNSQHLALQDVDLSYFDVLSQKVSPRESEEAKGVSEALQEIQQAIQLSKGVQLKNTLPGNNCDGQPVWVPRLSSQSSKSKDGCHPDAPPQRSAEDEDCDTDQETDRLLGAQRTDDKGFYDDKTRNSSGKKKSTSKEVLIHEPAVLIEGVLFRARYLGSTQLVCEGQPTKATRMMQAEEAVSRIKSLHNPARLHPSAKNEVSAAKDDEPFSSDSYSAPSEDERVEQMKISLCPHAAPEGETQPSTEVDLFISTEKIMVLNTDLKEIMMDHALRAISYIADIGDLVVLMARRRVMNSPDDPSEPKIKRTPKMICHVFESEEAQFIAQSIGQAFQVAYMEFLKANGIEDSSFVKEMDYQEVLNSQEIFGNELEMFAKKEKQKEVVVPKQKGEILGMVIVESGWGSMLPTVVIANMAQSGPAARCGQLNIGDQIIAINGISLVGLPLSTCQNYIKNTKNQTVVKLTVVPCAPVVEVKIKRPDTKYQLGFSVQNGVICSLLRGGIAERGGVRVGHRIIEINGQSVVAVPHEKIVNLLATSVGEIHMKTMPTSMFRLLTGQESPLYI